MQLKFHLEERFVGFSLNTAGPGEQVQVLYRELVGPADALHLGSRLDQFQDTLFGKIPGFPSPSTIDHLLIVIHSDLSGTAYINQLKITAKVRVTRDVTAGEPVRVTDIGDIASVDLGIKVPADAGVIVVRSHGWRRSLFFDLGPLLTDVGPREFPIEHALAQQALLLLGLPSTSATDAGGETSALPSASMAEGLARLKSLLVSKCDIEQEYQEVLHLYPWIFGGQYSGVDRHTKLDDKRIPDFTAVRCHDDCRDIIELKQPFLDLFRKDGEFASGFNDAWNQAENYLTFAVQQRTYLLEDKGLRFEIPNCSLVLGYDLTESQLKKIRAKEAHSRSIRVFTYDQLMKTGEHIVGLVRSAGKSLTTGVAG